MPFAQLLNRLASAELEFAYFNAQRTAAADSTHIRRGSTSHFDYLTDASRPDSAYYNRAVGNAVGAFPAGALEELPATVGCVELRPAEVQPETTSRLLALGYQPVGSLCYLAAVPPFEPLQVSLPVARLESQQTDLFFDLLESAGVPFPPERRADKRQFYCTERFQAFVATDAAGLVIGWSTLFLGNGTAFLGNSYTRPEMRGRGAHSALLAARLNASAKRGLRHIFTDVEHGSQSHSNCERAGFRTITINAIWQRRA